MTPKDKENIEILVKSLIEKDPSMIRVKDSSLIPYYLKNSKYMIEIEPEDKSELKFLKSLKPTIEEDFNDLKSEHLKLAKALNTNYIFASTYYENQGVLVSVVMPFLIISDKETDFLIQNFYKDVPEKVSKAAEELEIVLYGKIYSYYMQGKIDKFGEVLHENIEAWDKYSPFLNFVFNLPYEEQNIESNKKIIRAFSSGYDLIKIMTKEYAEGKHFQEYFENISHFEEKKVVESIKCLERKPDHDVYLLKKGYIAGEDSAVNLYKQDAQAFINYFRKLSDESRKIIIEKIYEDSFVNQEVVDWLEKSYTDLLREVGFSGGKQNGSNS
jgi:hypothetical protein